MTKKVKVVEEPKGPTRRELISEVKSIIDRVPDEKLEEFIDEIRAMCNEDVDLKICLQDIERIQLKDVASKRGIVVPEIDTLSLAKVKSLLNSIESLDISGTPILTSTTASPVASTSETRRSHRKVLGKNIQKTMDDAGLE